MARVRKQDVSGLMSLTSVCTHGWIENKPWPCYGLENRVALWTGALSQSTLSLGQPFELLFGSMGMNSTTCDLLAIA